MVEWKKQRASEGAQTEWNRPLYLHPQDQSNFAAGRLGDASAGELQSPRFSKDRRDLLLKPGIQAIFSKRLTMTHQANPLLGFY